MGAVVLPPGLIIPQRPRIVLPHPALLLPGAQQMLRRPLRRWWKDRAEDLVTAAVTVDQVLGTGKAHTNNVVSLSTAAAIASGGRAVLIAAYFNAGTGTTLTASGGGLTWAQDHFLSSGALRIGIYSAPAPAGLASATTLSATANGVNHDMMIAGISLLGVDTIVPVSGFNAAAASTAAWSSGNIAAGAGNAIVGGAFGDGLVGTSAAGGSNTEWADFNDATQSETMTGVRNLNTAATDSASGTFSGAVGHVAIGVAYLAAAGAAATRPNRSRQGRSRSMISLARYGR